MSPKNTSSKSIKPIGEFDLIAKYFAPLSAGCDGALSLLDDGAVFDVSKFENIVVTTDCLVEGVHFLKGTSGEHVANRALGANLSDLAAMGASPKWIFLALQLPTDHIKNHGEKWLESFSSGLKQGIGQYGIYLAGGDTVSTTGPLAVTITAMGVIKNNSALVRANAKPGDEIWVSGTIGDSALGLSLLKDGEPVNGDDKNSNFLINRHLAPEPRIKLGKALASSAVVSACIDISDGLVADMDHICTASGVSAEIELEKIPLSGPAINKFKNNMETVHDAALGGGDDYELLFCVSPKNSKSLLAMCTNAAPDIKLSKIGTIGLIDESSQNAHVAHVNVAVIDHKGAELDVKNPGWDHLR